MSGGHFDYKQWHIDQIAEDVRTEIEKSGRHLTDEEIKNDWRGPTWFKEYPNDLKYYEYPEEVIEEFRNGYNILKKAYVYAQRIDWLLSGDDGNESFINRLKEELNNLKEL